MKMRSVELDGRALAVASGGKSFDDLPVFVRVGERIIPVRAVEVTNDRQTGGETALILDTRDSI